MKIYQSLAPLNPQVVMKKGQKGAQFFGVKGVGPPITIQILKLIIDIIALFKIMLTNLSKRLVVQNFYLLYIWDISKNLCIVDLVCWSLKFRVTITFYSFLEYLNNVVFYCLITLIIELKSLFLFIHSFNPCITLAVLSWWWQRLWMASTEQIMATLSSLLTMFYIQLKESPTPLLEMMASLLTWVDWQIYFKGVWVSFVHLSMLYPYELIRSL